jgi:membrane-associated phospholipid phosphatase
LTQHDEEAVPERSLRSSIRPYLSRGLAIRVAIGVALIVAATLTNRSYLGWGLFVTFAIVLVPLGRVRSFALSFVPYAAVWFIFTALRSLADETALARTLNMNVSRFERWLFGGELPTITLQDAFYDPTRLQFHDYFLTGIHWSYFIIPHFVAVRAWQRDPALFRHFLSALTLLLGVGLGIYFLIPANPPWLAGESFDSPAAATVIRIMEPVGEALGGGLYQASYKVVGESNPIAAMPSIHMAITFLLVFPAAHFGHRWKILAWIYSALMAVALVYLGEHYVIDVAVGMLIAWYGWWASGVWLSGRALSISRGHPLDPHLPSGAPATTGTSAISGS